MVPPLNELAALTLWRYMWLCKILNQNLDLVDLCTDLELDLELDLDQHTDFDLDLAVDLDQGRMQNTRMQ